MAVEFKEEFISQITGDGKTRPEALREANIVDIINNRTDLSDTVKANRIKVVESLGVSGITLGDIADNTPAADTMYKNIVQQGFSNRLDSFIADFRGLLSEVGVLGKQTENPLRSRIKSAVGEPAYNNAGFSSNINRLIPLQYPVEAYTESKRIAAALMKNPATREAGGMMLMSMLGGYRKADFKNLRIENINFETGLVKGLDLKTDAPSGSKTTKKTRSVPIGYLPSAQRDVIKTVIGDKTSGLVFSNPQKLIGVITDALKTSTIPQIEYLQESTGEYVKQDFTFNDYRRIAETSLSAKGYDDDNIVRKALTWRPPSGNVQKYQAVIDASGAIEEANAKAFEPYVLLSEGNKTRSPTEKAVLTHGQFLSSAGVKEISPFTQRYVVTGEGVSKLPVHLQQVVEQKLQGISFSDKVISPVSINIDSKASGIYLEMTQEQMETQKIQAETEKILAQRELDKVKSEVPSPVEPEVNATAEEMYPDVAKKVGKPTLVDGAKDIASRILGNKTTKQVAVGLTTAATATKSMLPGPVEAAVTAVVAPEDFDIAEQKGRDFVEQFTDSRVASELGAGAGVGLEMITGGVADPEAPVRTSQFLASPIATIASGFINRDKETAPADMYKGGFLSN